MHILITITETLMHTHIYVNKKTIQYRQILALSKWSSTITTCSSSLLNDLKRLFPNIDQTKCIVVHNGVDQLFLSSKASIKKRNYIFSASRFAPNKGLDSIIRIFNAHPQDDILIAGYLNVIVFSNLPFKYTLTELLFITVVTFTHVFIGILSNIILSSLRLK